MTREKISRNTDCNCQNSCELLQNDTKITKKKGLLGLIAAMAICCITPLALGFVAGGATLAPFNFMA